MPKGRPISKGSKPHWHWSASRSTGSGRYAGSTSSMRAFRTPICGTIPSRRRLSRKNRSASKRRSILSARSRPRWQMPWSSSKWAKPKAMPKWSAKGSILWRVWANVPIATRCRLCFQARLTGTIPISRSTRARVVPKARIGRICSCACMRAGRNVVVSRWKRWNMRPANRLGSRVRLC